MIVNKFSTTLYPVSLDIGLKEAFWL